MPCNLALLALLPDMEVSLKRIYVLTEGFQTLGGYAAQRAWTFALEGLFNLYVTK